MSNELTAKNQKLNLNNKINTIVSDVAITHLALEEIFNYENNPIKEPDSIKCPHCGESYYMELYTTTTAAYYPPIYKNGVNINPGRNQSTTYCSCMNCGKEFSY